MKKILAILLAGVMSVTAFGFNASAVEKTDAEIQQEKLGYILNLNKDIWLDCAVIYDGVWPSIMDNAREVYDTDGLSADEYTVALKQVYDMYYDAPLVNIEYAEATYKNALKEENYAVVGKNGPDEAMLKRIMAKTGADMALMMSLDELSLEPQMGMREDYYKFTQKARIMFVNGLTGKVIKDRVNDEEMIEYPIIARSDYAHNEFNNTVIRELKKVAKF